MKRVGGILCFAFRSLNHPFFLIKIEKKVEEGGVLLVSYFKLVLSKY